MNFTQDHNSKEAPAAGGEQLILVTGAAGFIGTRVVSRLLELGYCNLRCLVRSARSAAKLETLLSGNPSRPFIEIVQGNLLSRPDCTRAVKDAAVILHLAAGRGEKSFPDALLNSVVSTRNLMDAALAEGCLTRFVNISSFSVYSNRGKTHRNLLNESCPMESHPERRGDAYTFAKVRQDELVSEYGVKFRLPYVIVRPGHVYGPGNEPISARVGIDTFGVFLHLGGSNRIPLVHVDNCADAIVLAGTTPGIEGEIFNVVDDNLPSSRRFLRLYKSSVKDFRSFYLPHAISYALCWMWESFSTWSKGELPPVFNRRRWHAFWKGTRYSNEKLKKRLGWQPRISIEEGLGGYFRACRERLKHA